MSKDILFKTLMLKGEQGGTIVSIEKIGSQGSTDYMRITLDDGSTVDFEVLNTLDDDHVRGIIAEEAPAIVSEAVEESKDYTDSKIVDVTSLVNTIYPVGSILMSTNAANPSTYLNVGTWEAWGSGRVPVGVNTSDTDFNTPNKNGGSKSNSYTPSGSLNGTVASHALGVDEIPSHSHVQWGRSDSISVQGGGSDGDYKAIYTAHMHILPPTVTGGNTGLTGGGQGHSHDFSGSLNGDAQDISTIQPYVTCYMWRRTA